MRWQRHSLRRVLDRWIGDPETVVLDQGTEQVERHLAEKFTLMNATHGAVALDVDAENHLPLRLSFEWRDPRFHDTNVDSVEFDNYHRVDGVATPFTVTRTHNGEIVEQTVSVARGIQHRLAGELIRSGLCRSSFEMRAESPIEER